MEQRGAGSIDGVGRETLTIEEAREMDDLCEVEDCDQRGAVLLDDGCPRVAWRCRYHAAVSLLAAMDVATVRRAVVEADSNWSGII